LKKGKGAKDATDPLTLLKQSEAIKELDLPEVVTDKIVEHLNHDFDYDKLAEIVMKKLDMQLKLRSESDIQWWDRTRLGQFDDRLKTIDQTLKELGSKIELKIHNQLAHEVNWRPKEENKKGKPYLIARPDGGDIYISKKMDAEGNMTNQDYLTIEGPTLLGVSETLAEVPVRYVKTNSEPPLEQRVRKNAKRRARKGKETYFIPDSYVAREPKDMLYHVESYAEKLLQAGKTIALADYKELSTEAALAAGAGEVRFQAVVDKLNQKRLNFPAPLGGGATGSVGSNQLPLGNELASLVKPGARSMKPLPKSIPNLGLKPSNSPKTQQLAKNSASTLGLQEMPKQKN